MRFDLDGLDVFFPYDRIYPEQFQYMRSLKQTLDAAYLSTVSAESSSGRGSHCLLEMPTGTGKTVSLLSLITSYQFAHPDKAGKLVYCTRTVPEMNSVMEVNELLFIYLFIYLMLIYIYLFIYLQELGVVLAYRTEQLHLDRVSAIAGVAMDVNEDNEEQRSSNVSTTMREEDENQGKHKRRRIFTAKKKKISPKPLLGPIPNAGGNGVLALCLSSRRNMCIHDRVINESDREAVDAACRSMTASWVLEKYRKDPSSIETCQYFNDFTENGGEGTSLPSGIYDLEQLRVWGKEKGWCPYYLTRRAINHANILVFNYQYMLDPKVAKMVSAELEAESIIVFDEAHNIDR